MMLATSQVAARNTPAERVFERAHTLLCVLLPTCLLFALFLRVYGANFGLPYLYYWDEPTVVNRAVRFGSGDLNPHFFAYPALYMYVLFLVSGLYFVVGRLTGHFHSAQDFAAEYFTDPGGVYMAARVTTALVGTAAVLVTYYVGKRFFGRRVGLLGALFLTASVLQASYSHIAITDVPHAFFIIAAYLPLYQVWRRGKRKDYLLAGLLIGLGIATKYLAFLLIPTLILAHLLRERRADSGEPPAKNLLAEGFAPNLLLGLGMVLLGFFLGAPFNLLDFSHFLHDYRAQMALTSGGSGNSISFFLFTVLPVDYGWPLLLLAYLGLALLLARHGKREAVFLSFPFLYFLMVMRYPKGFARYLIPEDPFLAILAAVALVWAFDRLARTGVARKPLTLVFAAIAVGVMLVPLSLLWRWDSLMAARPDTRTLAREWADRNIPTGSVIALQSLFNRTIQNAPVLTDRKLAKLASDMPSGGKFATVRTHVLETLQKHPVYKERDLTADYTGLKRSGVQYLFSYISPANGPEEGRLAPALQSQLDSGPVRCIHFGNWEAMRRLPESAGIILPNVPPDIRIYDLR